MVGAMLVFGVVCLGGVCGWRDLVVVFLGLWFGGDWFSGFGIYGLF